MRTLTMAALVLLVTAATFAHVTVFPQQAPAGQSQVYQVRVHNDSKVPTASIELQIPDGVTVTGVEKMATGTSSMKQTAGRTIGITWNIEVPVGKYVELAFTATNPKTGSLTWNVTETFKDGRVEKFT